METIPCRGCRTQLEPSATMCPICLRPRTSLEITRDYKQMRELDRLRRRRPFVLTGYAVLLGATGWLLFRFRAPLTAALTSAAATAKSSASNVLDEESGMKSARAQAASPAPVAAPVAASPGLPAAPAPARPGAPAAPPAAAAAPAAAEAPPRPTHVEDLPIPPVNSASQWAFYGRVYDLITLKPVANVQLSFSGGGSGGTTTDPDGRFATVLARLNEGSYEIRASHPNYASPVFYESDIPYAKLPLSERRELARNALDGDMTLPPLTDISGEDALRRDLFLAPRR